MGKKVMCRYKVDEKWVFEEDMLYDGAADLKGKPLAKDSYGHQIVMFFRNGKLIGLILHNDIP